jgi:hypothetical protein
MTYFIHGVVLAWLSWFVANIQEFVSQLHSIIYQLSHARKLLFGFIQYSSTTLSSVMMCALVHSYHHP